MVTSAEHLRSTARVVGVAGRWDVAWAGPVQGAPALRGRVGVGRAGPGVPVSARVPAG